MPFRSLPLPPAARGTLWLASMPGRLEPWDEFVAECRRVRLNRIVCLTPHEEITALSPAYARAVTTQSLPCAWSLVPMRNLAVGQDAQAFRRSVQDIVARLKHGDAVLLHCAAGMGRTGTAAACILKQLGLDSVQALQRVRDAGSNPQSAVQSGLIESF